MIRFYVIPLDELLSDGITFRAPKYIGFDGYGVTISALEGLENINNFTVMDYGFQPVCLFAADVTAEQHALLDAQTDVLAMPANLDDYLSGADVAVAQSMENYFHIPTDWITTSLTYRQALHKLIGMFIFMQRLHGTSGIKLFDNETGLVTQFNQLPNETQVALLSAASSLQLNSSCLSGSETLGSAIKILGEQFDTMSYTILGVSI